MISLLAAFVSASIGAPGTLVSCHDGDTCTLRIELGLDVSVVQRVRLCDIDAPELRNGGEDARATMESMLREASVVEVRPSGGLHSARYSFRRLLAWLVVDGEDAGQRLVKLGLAKASSKRCKP